MTTNTPGSISLDAEAIATDQGGPIATLALLVRDLAQIVGAQSTPESPAMAAPCKNCGQPFGAHGARTDGCPTKAEWVFEPMDEGPPRTLPERVLAAGLGEAQPEPQAVTPEELGGAHAFAVGYDASIDSWQATAEGGSGTFIVTNFHPTPEAAFGDVIERVRQSAHAANAQREAAEAIASGRLTTTDFCNYDDCDLDAVDGGPFCAWHQAEHEANMALAEAADALRAHRAEAAQDASPVEPNGYTFGP